ncbi:MAG: hypothetical protein ACRECX_02020 [Methyloceanibacter sp.]|uniref:hypothetical protein n=1 Tax=Methyloceanibacter sp. TaxID=1965321 RepID=UPI003D6CCF43
MTKRNPKRSGKREGLAEANEAVSRPEDPDTHRQRRAARLLRADMLPMGAAMITQDDELAEDSETKAALKRATDSRDRRS